MDDHRVVVYRIDVVLHFLLYKLFCVVEQIVLCARLVDSLESVKLRVLGHVCLNCRPGRSPSRVFCVSLPYRHVSVLSVSWVSAESPWRHSVALPRNRPYVLVWIFSECLYVDGSVDALVSYSQKAVVSSRIYLLAFNSFDFPSVRYAVSLRVWRRVEQLVERAAWSFTSYSIMRFF